MKIVFYNPSRIIGGAEHLFFRLYKLYLERGYECKVVDYSDGAFSKLGVPPEAIVAIGSVRQTFKVDCDFFILPPNFSYEALYALDANESARIFFWSIHPYNCIPTLPFSAYKKLGELSLLKRVIDFFVLGKQISYAKSLFRTASEKKSLVFMDGENYSYARRFLNYPVSRSFLPVPVPPISELASSNARHGAVRNFFWVGRLVDFKIGALNRLIHDLDTWSQSQPAPLTLHVVGSGEAEKQMRPATHLEVKKHGYLDNQSLHRMLASSADAVFSMGTSALEGAAIGLPSFIVMPTYQAMGDANSYMPLSETKNFDLGSFSAIEGLLGFNDLVAGNYFDRAYAAACKEYVFEHHDLAQVADRLLEMAKRSEFMFGEVKASYKKRFISRLLFSILKGK